MWEVPADSEYTVIGGGLLLVSEENFNEDTFYYGSGDPNVSAPQLSTKAEIDASVNKTCNIGDTWVARTYVRYKDAEGNTYVAYSDIIHVTKETNG